MAPIASEQNPMYGGPAAVHQRDAYAPRARRCKISVASRLWQLPLFERLAPAQRILVAGAGGGFDIYAGLPLVLALRALGRDVHLANPTFTYLGGTNARFPAPHVAEVDTNTEGEDRYFPERTLARWLASQNQPSTVYAFQKVGVRPMRGAYRALCNLIRPDAIVLVDGGTDPFVLLPLWDKDDFLSVPGGRSNGIRPTCYDRLRATARPDDEYETRDCPP